MPKKIRLNKNGDIITKLEKVWLTRDFDDEIDLWTTQPKLGNGRNPFWYVPLGPDSIPKEFCFVHPRLTIPPVIDRLQAEIGLPKRGCCFEITLT